MSPVQVAARGMVQELDETWRRWLAAEEAGREELAEGAFQTLWQLVPRPLPSAAFRAAVYQAAVEAATARRRPRRVFSLALAAGVAAAVVLGTIGAVQLVPFFARGVVWAVRIGIDGLVWMLLAFHSGLGVWDIVTRIGRAVVAALVAPRVTAVLIGVELVGAVALYALYRLVGSDKESS